LFGGRKMLGSGKKRSSTLLKLLLVGCRLGEGRRKNANQLAFPVYRYKEKARYNGRKGNLT